MSNTPTSKPVSTQPHSTSPAPQGAIGVFDSGVGGLTVLSALQKSLPHEQFIYIGDTARAPYGCKPVHLVAQFAEELATRLKVMGCKLVVIACNSATAAADIPTIAAKIGIPVVGVITATVNAALNSRGRIGVIATSATIRSGTYQSAIQLAGRECWAKDCPLFAPLVEEGLWNDPIAPMVAKHYLGDLPKDIETLILGCTHYPFLAHIVQAELPQVRLLDSAEATASAVATILGHPSNQSNAALPLAPQTQEGAATAPSTTFYTSGDKDTFLTLAQRLGVALNKVHTLPPR